MRYQERSWGVAIAGLCIVALLFLTSCSDGGTGGSEPGPTPAISIALSMTSATVAQGGSAQVNATLTRSGGFTGAVNLDVQGAPAGVSATLSQVQTNGGVTSAMVTIQVAAAVAPGSYNLTVRGSGSGVPDASVVFVLTITAGSGFTIVAAPGSISFQAGGSGTTGVTITRSGGYTGNITFAVTGAPAGMTAQIAPASTTGNTVQLTVTTLATLAPGNYTLTVTATAPSLPVQTITVQVTITQPSGSTATVNLSCMQVLWFAYQDGNGPWTRVTGTNNVFTFNIGSAVAGIAFVAQFGVGTQTIISLMTRAELTTAPFSLCPATPALKTVTGTAAGLGQGDAANFALGLGAGFAGANGNFVLGGVRAGTHDFIAWRHSNTLDLGGTGNPDRGIIRRDLDLANNASLGTVDFGGSEAFTPATATITVNGILAGESVNHTMVYYSTPACVFASLYGFAGTHPIATSFTASGVPAAMQRNTDFHQMSVTGLTRPSPLALPTAVRIAQESFRTLGNRTVSLPAALPVPTITTLPGSYKRLQASFNIPADYQLVTLFGYIESTLLRLVNISATLGWIGSSNAVLATPDFSTVAGWNNAWAPATNSTGTWTAAANGNNLGGAGVCVEGGRIVQADQRGSY